MNYQDFLKQLEAMKGEWASVKVDWRMKIYGTSEAPFLVTGFSLKKGRAIRLKINKKIAVNPVIAVCHHLTGNLYEPDDLELAAREIGLPYEVAEKICDAAEDRPDCDEKIRQDLLRIASIII